MSGKFFLDTNIIVYSFSEDSKKRSVAINLIRNALESGKGVVSSQVVQEFVNVALFKFKVPLKAEDCIEYIKKYLEPLCDVNTDLEMIQEAIRIRIGNKISFYDSLIIAAALQSECNLLYSEDLNHGQKIRNLKIVNPFK